MIKCIALFALAGADLSAPPYYIHFHESGRYFGNPMGSVRLAADKLFHFYFATPLDDPTDPKPGDHVMGAVGHATSPNLIDWTVKDPVVTPKEDCLIDGGSVIENGGSLIMYYAQRCCATLDCATEIYRSTSTDGSAWTTKEDAVLAFATAPFLTLPSVVYDPAKTRWVMTLSEAQASEKYQPTFYHSADGIDNWTAGGLFVPPAVDPGDGGPPHFQRFTNNFLMFMDTKWLMMGTREAEDDFESVFFIGTLDDTTAVFKSDYTNRGRPLLWDYSDRPFPVWNHENHDHVIMSVMNPAKDEDLYKPLSLPVWIEPAVGTDPDVDYEEYLRSDWVDEVKDEIDPGTARDKLSHTIIRINVPSHRDYEVLVFNGTLDLPASGGTDINLRSYAHVPLMRMNCTVGSHSLKVVDGGGREHDIPNLDAAGTQWKVSILVDHGVGEVNIGGWTFRYRWEVEEDDRGFRTFEFYSRSSLEVALHKGWTLGSAQPMIGAPTTTTTSTTTSTTTTTSTKKDPDSGGMRASVPAFLFLCSCAFAFF